MKLKSVTPTTATVLIAICLASLALSLFGLNSLSSPRDYPARLEQLDTDLKKAQGAAIQMRGATTRPVHLDCKGDPADYSEFVRLAVQDGARRSDMTVIALDVRPVEAERAGTAFNALRIQLEAEGNYDKALGLIAGLGDGQPAIFFNSIDFVPKAERINLKMTGRAFCWNDPSRP